MIRVRKAAIKRIRKAPVKQKINRWWHYNLTRDNLLEFGIYRDWMIPYISFDKAMKLAGEKFTDKRSNQ